MWSLTLFSCEKILTLSYRIVVRSWKCKLVCFFVSQCTSETVAEAVTNCNAGVCSPSSSVPCPSSSVVLPRRNRRLHVLKLCVRTIRHQNTPGSISRKPNPTKPMPIIVADDRLPSEKVTATGTAPTAAKPTPTAKMTSGPRYAGEMSGILMGTDMGGRRSLH